MSTFAKSEENYDSKETLVDTIKIDLIRQFKMRVDDINTEIIGLTRVMSCNMRSSMKFSLI